MIVILPGRFEFFFRDPDLYMHGKALAGDFCRWFPE